MRIPEELLPVVEFWERYGRQTIATAATAAVLVAGYYGVTGWMEARRVAAGEALMNAEGVEALEAAVASYGSSKSGAALKLRLAKAYFDARSFQSAADLYEELEGNAPEGFEDIPALGTAECLEAQEKFEEAIVAYDTFADARPASPFVIAAKIGAARCLAQNGDREGALARIALLKAECKDDDAATALVEAAEDLVKRWEKRSLFDAADAVAETLKQAEEVPAAEPEAQPEAQPEVPAEPVVQPEAPAEVPAAAPEA